METLTLTSSALTFDAAKHEYALPDGRLVPSVTSILHAVRIATDFEAIAARSSRLADAIEYRCALGTAVHAEAHSYDDDDLDWDAVDERVRPYLDAWAVFREAKGLTPVARERRLFHPSLFYAGTLDGVFTNPKGELVLADIKLGNPDDAGARYQTSAYEAAWMLEHQSDPIMHRWAVKLDPDRTIPYEIFDYSARPQSWRDFQVFQAALTVYGAQAGRSTR